MITLGDIRNMPRPKAARRALRQTIQFLGQNEANADEVVRLSDKIAEPMPDVPINELPLADMSAPVFQPKAPEIMSTGAVATMSLGTLAVIGVAGYLLYKFLKRG